MRFAALACLLLVSGCGRWRYVPSAPPDAGLDASMDTGAPPDASGDDAPMADAATDLDAGDPRDAGPDALSVDAGLDAPTGDAAVEPDAWMDDAGLPPRTIVQIAAGQTAVCVRLVDGTIQCAGTNSDGVLGIGSFTLTENTSLTPVPGVTGATDLRAGNTHMLVTTPTGVIGWGWNQDGALGIGDTTPGTSPWPLACPLLDGARRLAPARTSTCAIRPDGSLQCVGDNFFGQLGDGTRTDSTTPRTVAGLSNVTDVAGAEGHFCAVHDGGQVSCWGWGTSGQLGDGTNTTYQMTPVDALGITDAIAIGVGQSHTCAVRADRTLWCWGANDSGQLGDGTTTYRNTPAIVPGLGGVAEVVGGYVHTCARLVDGRMFCFGWNANGQLGDGTTMDSLMPVQVMGPTNAIQLSASDAPDFNCALYADRVVRCWGDNGSSAFGLGTMSGTEPVPVEMLPPM